MAGSTKANKFVDASTCGIYNGFSQYYAFSIVCEDVMSKSKKDAKTLNVNIDRQVYELFEAYCKEMGQTKTTAIERILIQYLSDLTDVKGGKE